MIFLTILIPDGKYLAVVERRENKDCVSLFACQDDWGVARHFELTSEMDAAGLKWSSKSDCLCVYSTKLQCLTSVHSLDGRCLFMFKPEDIGLSLSTVNWSHCGSILAIATSVAILLVNSLTWSVISEFDIPTTVEANQNTVGKLRKNLKTLKKYV